jgi:hypothetical protein
MMKNFLIGSAAAQIIQTSDSFCGCGDCSVDWLPGSSTAKDIISDYNCDQFVRMLSIGADPSITITNGEACIDMFPLIRGSEILG